jgi:hypothetical protein
MAVMDGRPDLGDAALALAAVAFDMARVPVRAAERLPGMRLLATEGAAVRARLRSRLAGLAEDVLRAPEVERALDRVIAGGLPDAVVRSLLEHHVVERTAAELAATADLDGAITAMLEHETTQRLVQAVLASPGLDRMLAQATDRALGGPEVQRVIEHVASSPEIREALTRQNTTLAEEMVAGMRTRAETLDDAAERTVRGSLRRPRPT